MPATYATAFARACRAVISTDIEQDFPQNLAHPRARSRALASNGSPHASQIAATLAPVDLSRGGRHGPQYGSNGFVCVNGSPHFSHGLSRGSSFTRGGRGGPA
jgi:hypothetical protein